MNIRNFFRTLAVVAAFATASQANATVVLQVTGGILMGATGVNVGGKLYDVTFADGTCAAVYGSCTQSAFNFSTKVAATSAAQALLDQVFVDGPSGLFDSNPALTFGCLTISSCYSLVPYGINGANLLTQIADNSNPNFSLDSATSFVGLSTSYNSTSSLSITYAVFKLAAPAAATVPEPNSIALMGLALFGLAFARRRQA